MDFVGSKPGSTACLSYLTSISPSSSSGNNSTFLHGVVTHVKGLTHNKCSMDTGDRYFTITVLEEFSQNSSNKTKPPYPYLVPSIWKVSDDPLLSL